MSKKNISVEKDLSEVVKHIKALSSSRCDEMNETDRKIAFDLLVKYVKKQPQKDRLIFLLYCRSSFLLNYRGAYKILQEIVMQYI